MGVLVEVDVAYEENLGRAIEVIDRLCREVAGEKPGVILEVPRVLGVTQLGESGVTLQVFGKVKPMEQWAVGRELRKRIKETFDQVGIEIPYPRRVIIPRQQEGAKDGASDAVPFR
jgi:small conductance mechanosensitive channel